MQYYSYFPGYYSARSLNLDASGSTWPLNFDDKASHSGNYCNSYSSSNYLLTYNKELLKQTMLKHETIFKDQVNLYAHWCQIWRIGTCLLFHWPLYNILLFKNLDLFTAIVSTLCYPLQFNCIIVAELH